MSERVDTLQVCVHHRHELEANSADLTFSVKGSSWFTGKAAFEKAREVNRFVSDLKAVGIQEEDIQLRNVRVEVSQGLFSRSSSAHYTLLVRCRQLERLDDILTTATSQKTAVLDSVRWDYPDQQEADLQRLEQLLAQATHKAGRMARALGVELAGVHSLIEELDDPDEGERYLGGGSVGYSKSRAVASFIAIPVEKAMEAAHRKQRVLSVKILYLVKPQDTGSSLGQP